MQTMSLYNTGSKIDTRNTGTDFTRKGGNRKMTLIDIVITGILSGICCVLIYIAWYCLGVHIKDD